MLFFVFGLPGGFSEWCEAAAVELVRRAGGSATAMRADTLDQITLAAIATSTSHAVVSSPQPGGRLRAALLANRRSFVVALDEPRRALLDLVLDQEIELAAAVRVLASACAALSGLANLPGAMVLSGRDRGRPAVDTVAAIARHLRIEVGEADIAEVADTLGAAGSGRPQSDAMAWWNGLDAAGQALLIGALMPFVEAPGTDGKLAITWAPELFFLGDQAGKPAAGPIDITGRARCLLNGPHIVLPPGSWSLSLTALFSRDAAEHQFLVELCTDRPLASGVIRPQQEGSAAVTLDFVLDEAVEHPVAIRLSSQRAAFDGAITIVGARLVRAVDATPASHIQAPVLTEA